MAGSDDRKDEAALRTIGEVSAALGIGPHVLRYWEQRFPALAPMKRAGGRRLYRAEDVALIQRIDRLVNQEGFTLKGARIALEREAGIPVPRSAAPEPTASASSIQAGELLPRLRAIRAKLAAVIAA